MENHEKDLPTWVLNLEDELNSVECEIHWGKKIENIQRQIFVNWRFSAIFRTLEDKESVLFMIMILANLSAVIIPKHYLLSTIINFLLTL